VNNQILNSSGLTTEISSKKQMFFIVKAKEKKFCSQYLKSRLLLVQMKRYRFLANLYRNSSYKVLKLIVFPSPPLFSQTL